MESTQSNLLFALDIGTRSVVGLVGQKESDGTVNLIASEREEHNTRAMLDGQIHDVPEVAEVLLKIRTNLEQKVGPLKKVAVAAAGRALCTMRVTSEIDTSTRGTLTSEDEIALELAAIQIAQKELAASNKVADPSSYYCIGYSVVTFILDGVNLTSLVGQWGKVSCVDAIATFLPRQVIDSLQSAVQTAGLELSTITLEPIAAINVLIPSTMRHLNLSLVDIGAGTSDVAITRDGSVIGFGMVPIAGDEITEAISQHYLLDFNVAEAIKRQLDNKNKKISFEDVLGSSHKVNAQEFINCITPKVGELAKTIAAEILKLNAESPQAVLLVGGGSMTPLLPELLAEALNIPANRVAVRLPTTVKDITNIPEYLCTADAVTPLGILKVAGGNVHNFINVTVNERPLKVFNISNLSVSDALLTAGIDVRTLRGRPGMGITISINGQTKFIPGGHGKSGTLTLNGNKAKLSDTITDGDAITVVQGVDGEAPAPLLKEFINIPPSLLIVLDGIKHELPPMITINKKIADIDNTILKDRDKIEVTDGLSLAQVLDALKKKSEPVNYKYIVNGSEQIFKVWPRYKINGNIVEADYEKNLAANDIVETMPSLPPSVGKILGLSEKDITEVFNVKVNDSVCQVPIRRYTVLADKQPISLDKTLPDNTGIEYSYNTTMYPILSDVLLASKFNAKDLTAGTKVDILLNGMPAEYTAEIKNGDRISIKITAPP